jgi:hypothetical protein
MDGEQEGGQEVTLAQLIDLAREYRAVFACIGLAVMVVAVTKLAIIAERYE